MGLLGVAKDDRAGVTIHPTAIVHPDARIGAGTIVGPYVDDRRARDASAATAASARRR